MALVPGKFLARARGAQLGVAGTGTEQIAVEFEVTEEGDYRGERITWFGFFSDKTYERTLEALRHCGWQGDDLRDLTGIDQNEVELDCSNETDPKGNVRLRVQWVNKPGGMRLKQPMTDAQSADFAERMKAKVIAHRQAAPAEAAPAGKATPF